MNVLFLIPPSPDKRNIIRLIECGHETKAAYLCQPNDYLIISSLLAPDDKSVLIDGTADRLVESEFISNLRSQQPDLVFFALASSCWESDYRIFQEVRRLLPSVPLYLIGDVFLEDNYLSFILPQCEGVVFIPQLLDLKAMVEKAEIGNEKLPGLRTLSSKDDVPTNKAQQVITGIPRHELFQKKGYIFPFARHFRFTTVTTMWGCPFSCFYCNMQALPPVVRNWQDVVSELEYVQQLGIKEIYIYDRAFGFPSDNVNNLLDEMIKRFKFSWSCFFHPQMYKPNLLDKMHAAGCHTIIIGLESSDQASLKQYQRNVQSERISQLLEHANRLGMDVCADFMIGLEHETEEDILRTIDYACNLPIDFLSLNVACPFPGSGIRKKKVADGEMVFGQEGFDNFARSGVMSESTIARDRIIKLRDEWVRSFYLRPGYLLRRLKKTKTFEHLLLQCYQMFVMFTKK